MQRPADRTGRLLRQLEGRDRFRYAVEVIARGQEAEFDRALFEARRVDCSSVDPEMAAAFEEFRSLMREFDATTRKLFGSLLAIDVLRDLFARVGVEAEVGDLPVFSVPQMRDLMEELATAILTRLKAVDQAFGELGIERLGLEPGTLRGVQPGWVQAGLSATRERIVALPVDADEVADSKAELLAGWGPEGLGAERRPGERS